MLSRVAANTNSTVFGLTQLVLEYKIYRRQACQPLHNRCSFNIKKFIFQNMTIEDMITYLLKYFIKSLLDMFILIYLLQLVVDKLIWSNAISPRSPPTDASIMIWGGKIKSSSYLFVHDFYLKWVIWKKLNKKNFFQVHVFYSNQVSQ